jgi:hypothetical protein
LLGWFPIWQAKLRILILVLIGKIWTKIGFDFPNKNQIPIGLYSFRTKVLFMYEIGMKMKIRVFEEKRLK